MKVKDYEIFKTWKKTARENNLAITENHDTKNLFDFSLLDNIDIPETEKEIVKDDALKNVCGANKINFYIKTIDDLTACTGTATFHVQKVFSKTTCKLLYRIFTLTRIEHFSQSRKSVYDQKYDIETYRADNGFTEPVFDIEI